MVLKDLMKPNILLVNPPVYDFAAYDFWLKPYGLLSVGGFLRDKANLELFDYLDRLHPLVKMYEELESDRWGRGRFPAEKMPNPKVLEDIPRYFRRFGLPRKLFVDLLSDRKQLDFVIVQTMMTYWYPGVKEVIEDVRRYHPETRIILGGPYASICPEHAESLGADHVVKGIELKGLWKYMQIEGNELQPGFWEGYAALETGVLKLSQGCAFNCSYCSVPKMYKVFKVRPFERCSAELDLLVKLGAKNINFYDDALLYKAEEVFIPFLEYIISKGFDKNFHTPNALNARFVTPKLAELMVKAGFKTFFLGFESSSNKWQKLTGGKVYSDELADAVECLENAGADKNEITAYQIIGHPASNLQELEESIYFVNKLGIRGMLADYSPIPSTEDGEKCREWIDLDEPLMHNKTAFPIIRLGFDEVNRLKDLQRKLNRNLNK